MATIASDHASAMARGRKRKDAYGKNASKKFTCQNDGCGRTFTRAEHLQRHLLNHSNGEYTCDRCRAHFKRRDLLGKDNISYLHVRNRFNHSTKLGRVRTCSPCSYTSVSKVVYQLHTALPFVLFHHLRQKGYTSTIAKDRASFTISS
jgi:hypothetical protein